MAVQVKDQRESEGRSVMERIRSCDITRRESGQTSLRSFLTRDPDNLTKEAKQTMDQPSAAAHDTKGERRKRTPEEIVSQLQARIVKAQEAGRYNKVKALQYLLTRSQSARQLAVERVTENDGKKTPGVDGET